MLRRVGATPLDRRPRGRAGAFGSSARKFLTAILPVDSAAQLALDVEQRDQYGRLLAYVYRPDGLMVNAMMVRQGFAVPFVVPPNVQHIDAIRAAADSARAGRVGLWAVEAFECAPKDYRDGRCGELMTDRAPESVQLATSVAGSGEYCHPSYLDVCIPPPPPDLDCADIPHRRFRVLLPDPHRFDGDHDGIGCEGRR